MTPYYERDGITIYCGDCLEIMPQLEGPFDAIMADLPYGTTAAKWDKIISLAALWREYKRLIKKNGAIALNCKQPFTTLLGASNFDWLRYELIWKKSNGGEFLNANRKPLPRHENILIFSNGQTTYNPQMTEGKPYACTSAGVGITTDDLSVIGWKTENDGYRYPVSVLDFPNETGLHPTQKPVALLRYLIRTYTNPGDLILDNTIGSGTTLVAAQNEGRQAVGIDTSEAYCKMAVSRLRQKSFFSLPQMNSKSVNGKQLTLLESNG